MGSFTLINMRTSILRRKKYAAKLEGRVMPFQGKNFAAAIHRQVAIEHDVKAILTRYGTFPYLNHFYMEFGKVIWHIKRNYAGLTACNEADGALVKWRSRGLDEDILTEIKELYIRCPSPPSENPFLLDVSLLDGPDILS